MKLLGRAPVVRLPDGLRGWDAVVGLNARNVHISEQNPPASIRLVNDKFATKRSLDRVGAPTAPTLALIGSVLQLRRLDLPATLGEAWALKPNQGLAGNGVLIVTSRDDDGWRRASGARITERDIRHHVRMIIDGEFSGRGRDAALVEPLIVADERIAALSYRGLPDVRVICTGDQPRRAMLRLPTSASGGRANLHQGAIGAAVDLESGRVVAAVLGGATVTEHPDTGARLIGAEVPEWSGILDAASVCSEATGLRYLGVDVVVDADAGPLVLEVNARPGLQIQNVTGRGLWDVLLAEEQS